MKSFKYRIYPNKKQKILLQQTLDTCRWVYNTTLEVRKKCWEESKLSISVYDCNKLLANWKKDEDKNFLNYVYSQILQETQQRLDKTFQSFFCRVRKGEKPGYPRFQGYDRYDSFTYPQSGFALIGDKHLKLSKIGKVRIHLSRSLGGVIKTLTVKRSATGKWFVIFSCETEPVPLPQNNKSVGIDLGLESFATFSDGTKIENSRFFRQGQAKLADAQRRLDKEAKGTQRRKKLKYRVATIHERITNKRNDFTHKLSREIVNDYGTIVFEKLDIQQMQQTSWSGISKSIGDAAWNSFTSMTSYKAEWASRKVIFVDPKNTSQKCSRCGEIVRKDLSVRVHRCECGLVLDRDHNAALNILALGT